MGIVQKVSQQSDLCMLLPSSYQARTALQDNVQFVSTLAVNTTNNASRRKKLNALTGIVREAQAHRLNRLETEVLLPVQYLSIQLHIITIFKQTNYSKSSFPFVNSTANFVHVSFCVHLCTIVVQLVSGSTHVCNNH